MAVAIDDVWDIKIDALDAHVSQMYEWLPWVDGRPDQVPKDAAARKAWLANSRPGRLGPEITAALQKRYGAEAAKIRHAEAFELCEYGRRPQLEELQAMFPK